MFRFLRREIEQEDYIGEVYCYSHKNSSWGTFAPHNSSGASYPKWKKFTRNDRDIYQDHDGFVSIFGVCFKESDVIFYDKVAFGAAREKIESKYRK